MPNPPPPGPLVRFAAAIDDAPPEPWPAASVPPPVGGAGRMTVPALAGTSVRVALRRLHKLGLRVRLEGGGMVRATVPGAGAEIAAGDTIRVLTGEVAPPLPARASEAGSGDPVGAAEAPGRGG